MVNFGLFVAVRHWLPLGGNKNDLVLRECQKLASLFSFSASFHAADGVIPISRVFLAGKWLRQFLSFLARENLKTDIQRETWDVGWQVGRNKNSERDWNILKVRKCYVYLCCNTITLLNNLRFKKHGCHIFWESQNKSTQPIQVWYGRKLKILWCVHTMILLFPTAYHQ